MTQPYAKRISVADIKAKVKMAAFRGFAMALLATIHGKIDSKIAEKEARYSNHWKTLTPKTYDNSNINH